MIFDELKNIGIYKNISSNIKTAIEWVQKTDLNSLKVGEKIVVDGDKVFATLYEYDTTPAYKQPFEGHLRYIDLQIFTAGAETIEVAFKTGNEEIEIPYDAVKERFKTTKTDGVARFTVKAGDFAIFYPQDLHKTCINPYNVEKVKRIVVKVEV
ncbi:MAG: YhcH/YjgK/YiaL family protein [Rickettsiales bacterium]|jgi:YhcH/YjgK/YiaL family protein|nr:YhcH/YjgK/YiaL family protein [Rickettsiales bacterium]